MRTPEADVLEIVPNQIDVPSLGRFWRTLADNRYLLWQLAVREFLGPFRGSVLGALWAWIYPMVLLMVYAFVFSFVFKMRWGGQATGGFSGYALVLFASFIPFNFLSAVLQRSTSIVVSHGNLVSKVVFPLEILPVSVVVSALLQMAVTTAILLVAAPILIGCSPFGFALAVPVLVLHVFFTTGLAFFLSSLAVFVRDIGNLVGISLQVLFFLTPITYPESAFPARFRWVVDLNPLATVVRLWREAILFGKAPDWTSLGGFAVVAVVVFAVGYWWFHRTRKAFIEVL
jgi:lipopolysaccharide transport system permease protein